MAQIDVKDAAGTTHAVAKVINTGSAADADSMPVALSTEAKALLGTKVTAVGALGAGGTGMIGWLSQVWNELATRLPATLGAKTGANSLSVVQASDAPFALQSSGRSSKAAIVRPANVTQYTAGDVVGGVLEFANIAPAGSHLVIQSADLRYDVSASPSGMGAFRLHLYDVTPPSALADNAVWSLLAGDRASYLGWVDIGTLAVLGATLFIKSDSAQAQVKLDAAQTSLWGYLQTLNQFTPANNSETLGLRLGGIGL